MKKVKLLMVGVAMLVATTVGQAQDPSKVKINHRTQNGSFVEIEVSIFALPAHLLHGDVLVDDGDDDGGNGCLDC